MSFAVVSTDYGNPQRCLNRVTTVVSWQAGSISYLHNPLDWGKAMEHCYSPLEFTTKSKANIWDYCTGRIWIYGNLITVETSQGRLELVQIESRDECTSNRLFSKYLAREQSSMLISSLKFPQLYQTWPESMFLGLLRRIYFVNPLFMQAYSL